MHPFTNSFIFLFVLGREACLRIRTQLKYSAAEYFVDVDPGEGNGTALTAQDGAFDSEVEAIAPVDFNVTGLSVGPHLIGIRYKDNNNTWGEILYQTIHVYDANPFADQNVTTRLEAENSNVANDRIRNFNGDTYLIYMKEVSSPSMLKSGFKLRTL